MMVKSVDSPNAPLLHQDKGNAVSQRVLLVLMTLEELPARIEEGLVHMNELQGRTMQQVVAKLDRLDMIAAAVEEGHRFIEDIGGRHQWWEPLGNTAPMGQGSRVVLTMGQFQGQQVTGIEEERH